jgi:hypothetical protein
MSQVHTPNTAKATFQARSLDNLKPRGKGCVLMVHPGLWASDGPAHQTGDR